VSGILPDGTAIGITETVANWQATPSACARHDRKKTNIETIVRNAACLLC
jgi:hypothetical protein